MSRPLLQTTDNEEVYHLVDSACNSPVHLHYSIVPLNTHTCACYVRTFYVQLLKKISCRFSGHAPQSSHAQNAYLPAKHAIYYFLYLKSCCIHCSSHCTNCPYLDNHIGEEVSQAVTNITYCTYVVVMIKSCSFCVYPQPPQISRISLPCT